MINNVIAINKQGLSHEKCEDNIYIDKNNSVFVVCDGVSNSINGGEGAKALSENIGKAISNEKAQKHLALDSVSNIRNTMVNLIKRSSDLTIKKLNCNLNDIASTMIVVSVWNNVITVIHAGDGAVFAAPEVYQDEVPLIISFPDNDAKQRVFPAASPRQLERMRVVRFNAGDIKCLAFGTDGFTDAYLRPRTNGFDGYGLNEIFKVNNTDDLEELIKRKHLKRPAITDDISAIIVKFDNNIKYTGSSKIEPLEESTEKVNKLTINNKEVEQSDNATIEPVSIDEFHETKDYKKVGMIIIAIISSLVICCMVAVFYLTNNLNKVSHDADEQISILSEEISRLQDRVDGLENTATEEGITTGKSENTTSLNDEDELTKATENTVNYETESQDKTTYIDSSNQQSTTKNYRRY